MENDLIGGSIPVEVLRMSRSNIRRRDKTLEDAQPLITYWRRLGLVLCSAYPSTGAVLPRGRLPMYSGAYPRMCQALAIATRLG